MSGPIFLALAAREGLLWGALSLVALLGALAVFSPAWFGKLATRGSRWVDTNKLAEVLDKRIDIDRHVLPFSRLLGAAVLMSVVVFAYLLVRYT